MASKRTLLVYAFFICAALVHGVVPKPGKMADEQSDNVQVLIFTADEEVGMGLSISFDFSIVIKNESLVDMNSLFLYPYVNGRQWGSEVYVIPFWFWHAHHGEGGSSPNFELHNMYPMLPLPVPSESTTIQVQLLNTMLPLFPVGNDMLPANDSSVLATSNVLIVRVTPRHIDRPIRPRAVGMFWEPWFTPLNMEYWTTEAVPLIGRYSSMDEIAMRQHALWFMDVGVDFLGVDWTNNLWGKTSWKDRNPNVQELVNATLATLEVYANMLHDEALPVPQFVFLLGLDNGPSTTLDAISEEIDFIATAILANDSLGELLYIFDDRPLIVIFDGTGADHSTYTHPNFTIRWMASQLQQTYFNNTGYWSWMDGSVSPVATWAQNHTVVEAVTVTPAFFVGGKGWLNTTAWARRGGATMALEYQSLLPDRLPLNLLVCQWNEFAGQRNGEGYGPDHNIYVDSYNADLSNDIEPTSWTMSGYIRPEGLSIGWGYYYLNLMRALTDLTIGEDTLMKAAANAQYNTHHLRSSNDERRHEMPNSRVQSSTFITIESPNMWESVSGKELVVSWSGHTFFSPNVDGTTRRAQRSTEDNTPAPLMVRVTLDQQPLTWFTTNSSISIDLDSLHEGVHVLEIDAYNAWTVYPLGHHMLDTNVPRPIPQMSNAMVVFFKYKFQPPHVLSFAELSRTMTHERIACNSDCRFRSVADVLQYIRERESAPPALLP